MECIQSLLWYSQEFILQDFYIIIFLLHILEKLRFPLSGKFKIFHIFFLRIFYDFVFDISDVHPILYVIPKMILHHSANHVIADVVSSMAHMTMWIDSRSTSIPSNIFAISRNELFLNIKDISTISLVKLFLSLSPVQNYWFI